MNVEFAMVPAIRILLFFSLLGLKCRVAISVSAGTLKIQDLILAKSTLKLGAKTEDGRDCPKACRIRKAVNIFGGEARHRNNSTTGSKVRTQPRTRTRTLIDQLNFSFAFGNSLPGLVRFSSLNPHRENRITHKGVPFTLWTF